MYTEPSVFSGSSLRQFNYEKSKIFFIPISQKSGHILEKTQKYGLQLIFFQLSQGNKNLP